MPAFTFAETTSHSAELIKDGDKLSQMEEIVTENQSLLEKAPVLNQELQTMEGDKDVSVIVQLSEEPVALAKGAADVQGKTFSLAEEATIKQNVASQQTNLIKELETDNIAYTENFTYDHVLNGMSITIKASELDNLIQMEGVIRVDPVEEMHALEINPDDEMNTFMDKSIPHLDIPELWDDGITGEGVKVAVLDTGIDYEHPDLEDVYKGGLNFIEHDDTYTTDRDDDDPYETTPEERPEDMPEFDPETGSAFYTSHGTHVAGTIAAQGNNDYDIKGIAPDVDLYAYRVLGAYGSGASDGVIAAIERAAEEDMDIINLSLGGGGNNQAAPDAVAINNATLDGVTAVLATGNAGPGRGTIGNPASSAYGIGVGNSTLPEPTYDVNLNVAAGDFTDNYDARMMAWEYATDPEDTLSGKHDVIAVPGFGEESDFEGLDIEGNVALVSRGDIAFVDKITAANEAGAAGIIIHNNLEGEGPSGFLLGQTFDFIPTFDIPAEEGEALREAIENADDHVGTVTFSDYEKGEQAGDEINETSSQGPTTPTFDIKPDVVAPGTNIMSTVPAYGKVYDDAAYGKAYDVMTGTSMATPHVAGIAALLLSKNPDWTPVDVKVALSNTAKQLDTEDYDVFSQGPGLVQPVKAASPEALAYVLDETTYEDDGETIVEDYEKGAVTFGRIRPDPDEETTFTKEIEVRDLVGKGNDYDVEVETTKHATGELADTEVTVDTSSFTLDGTEMLEVTLTVPKGEEDPGNEILGYIHLTSDSNSLILPFAADLNTQRPTGLEYYYLDDEIISPNGDGVMDETKLNFSLHDDQQNVVFELWSATDPGPADDHYIGYLDAGSVPAGAYYLPIDGTYMDWETTSEEDIPDGVYTIDFNKLDLENGDMNTMAYAPLMVKTAEPEVAVDKMEDNLTEPNYVVTGTVLDKFIDFKEIYETVFDEAYDVNDYLSAEYELTDENDAVVDSGPVDVNQDGTFDIPLSELESGEHALTISVDDVVGMSAQQTIEFDVDIVDIALTLSPTDYTTGAVTVEVETESNADVVELKWIPGEKDAGDFAEEGNDILDTNAFEVEDNGTYTVYAKNEIDSIAVQTIDITNITEPIEMTLTPSTDDFTVEPVTVDVSAESPVELTELKWLLGERDMDEFTDAGNDILATGQFDATQNGTYTVYAQNEYGMEALQMIDINTITEPVDISLKKSTDELTDEPIDVTIDVDSVAPLTDLKWLQGDRIAEDIDKNGNNVLDEKSFEVTENDAYTVLAKNDQGIYAVEQIVVNNIQDDMNLFFKPETVDPTEGPLAITIETDSLSELDTLMWLKGNKDKDDFADGQGNNVDLDTKTFDVTENGLYTVYAVNEKGIETVNLFAVDNIAFPVTLDVSQTPTEPTYNPVTVHVGAASEADIMALRWLPGEKNVLDFEDSAGNAIDLETSSFEVNENGTYTVYAVSSEGYAETVVLEVTNIDQREAEVTSIPAIEDGNAIVSDGDIDKLADEGTFVIDLGKTESANIQLSGEQISVLRDKNATLFAQNNHVQMEIPLSNLPSDSDITLGFQLSDDVDNAVSNVYDLTIHAADEEISTFGTPIHLTFQVNMDKVEKKENLDVHYFDEDTNEWVVISGGTVEDGEINIDVNHFTMFAVLEKKEDKDDSGDPGEKESDQCECTPGDDSDNGGSNGDNSNNGIGNNNGVGNGNVNGNNGKKIHNNQNGNGIHYDGPRASGTDGGAKLPSTATSIYNYVLVGAALLIAGTLALFIYRKKRKKETV